MTSLSRSLQLHQARLIKQQMQETLNFLSMLDSTVKRNPPTITKSSSLREKVTTKRSRFPYSKALNFNLRECEYRNEQLYPKWLTRKQGFLDFMYSNYQKKLMSIPSICDKRIKASDEKYFLGLYLQQLPLFNKLPSVVIDIVLSHLTSKYFKAGDVVHPGGEPEFLGIVFAGILTSKAKQATIYQKNQIICQGAFYNQPHEPIVCKQEAILLTIDKTVYRLITAKLRQQIQQKERDQIQDLLKSTFFIELHLKDKKAQQFFNLTQMQFYLEGQTIVDAGSDPDNFYLLFRGDVIQENHIYIREHNKWPLPDRKWEVRAVYNSYHKENRLKRFDFFGDEQIGSDSKFKSRYVASSWAVLFVMDAKKFVTTLGLQETKRLKKFRNQHIDINYGDFEMKIRKKVRSLSEQRNIVKKAISGSLAFRDNLTPRKMKMISSFEKTMLNKTFFQKGSEKGW